MEAHERWAYDGATGTRTLRQLICLCSSCPLVTYFGHANITRRTYETLMHLRAVTGMSERAWAHIDAAGDLWRQRSYRVWHLDLSTLTTAGVTLPPQSPPPIELTPLPGP